MPVSARRQTLNIFILGVETKTPSAPSACMLMAASTARQCTESAQSSLRSGELISSKFDVVGDRFTVPGFYFATLLIPLIMIHAGIHTGVFVLLSLLFNAG